ncbi:hypothetical protein Tco_0639034 [Tanacetum coccineum]
MANLKFCDKHNMVAYLQKSEGSEGFHQIVDFLNTCHINTLENGDMEITATINGKVKIVSEASIRRHLKLEDSDGISDLPTTEIFKQLALMGQETEVPHPSSPTQTHVTDEAPSTGMDDRHEGATTTVSGLDAGQGSGNIDKTPTMPHDSPFLRVHTLGSDKGRMQQNELMDLVIKLIDKVEVLENDLKQTKRVYGAAFTKLIKKVMTLEKTVKSSKARRKTKLVVSDDEEEDSFNQGRKIGRQEHDLEPNFEFTDHEEVYTAEPNFSTANVPVSTAGAEVSTAILEVSTTTKSLVYIKRSAAKRVDKGKAIMKEAEPQIKKLSFDEIKKLFKTTIKRVKDFVPMKSDRSVPKIAAGSSKRDAEEKLNEEISKRQKIEEGPKPAEELKDKESDELSQEQLQQLMIIVPKKGMNVEALQTKYPIIDWEVYSEDTMKYWKIIRDLVKERFSSTEPTYDKEKALWVELKRLFEPKTDDLLELQRYMYDPLTWRLYDTCGVHHVST